MGLACKMRQGCHGTLKQARLKGREPGEHARCGKAPPPEALGSICRICWEGAEAAPSPLLTDTCDCSGSLSHVHAHCLFQWQRVARDPTICATCKAPVRIPGCMAAMSSRLPLQWAAWVHRERGRLAAAPCSTLLKWWGHMVAAVALAHTAGCSQRAWLSASGVAAHLRSLPLSQGRWQVLVGVAAAAMYQSICLPSWLRVPPRVVGMHAACYAVGVALDLGAGMLVGAMASYGGGVAVVASWLCKVFGLAGVALQMSAVQHLHPLQQFVAGYARGVNRACTATGSFLARAARAVLELLGGGGRAGRLLASATGALPYFLHSLAHTLALAGWLAP